jgi:hypothetical protein
MKKWNKNDYAWVHEITNTKFHLLYDEKNSMAYVAFVENEFVYYLAVGGANNLETAKANLFKLWDETKISTYNEIIKVILNKPAFLIGKNDKGLFFWFKDDTRRSIEREKETRGYKTSRNRAK